MLDLQQQAQKQKQEMGGEISYLKEEMEVLKPFRDDAMKLARGVLEEWRFLYVRLCWPRDDCGPTLMNFIGYLLDILRYFEYS